MKKNLFVFNQKKVKTILSGLFSNVDSINNISTDIQTDPIDNISTEIQTDSINNISTDTQTEVIITDSKDIQTDIVNNDSIEVQTDLITTVTADTEIKTNPAVLLDAFVQTTPIPETITTVPTLIKSFDNIGKVFYISSFSKTLAPALRIGWVAASEKVIEQLADIRMQSDYGSSILSQAVVYEMLKRLRLKDEKKHSHQRKTERKRTTPKRAHSPRQAKVPTPENKSSSTKCRYPNQEEQDMQSLCSLMSPLSTLMKHQKK